MQKGEYNQELSKLKMKKQDMKMKIQKCYRILCQQDNVGLFNDPPDYYSSELDIDTHPVLKIRKNIMRLEMEHDHVSNLIQKFQGDYGQENDGVVDNRTTCNCPSNVSMTHGRDRADLSDYNSDRSDRSRCSLSIKSSKQSRPSRQSRQSRRSKDSKASRRSKESQQNSLDCSSWEMCHPPKRVEIIGVIVRVFPRSPGRKAGLRPGDFIVQFGDIDAHNYDGNPSSIVEYAEDRENQRIRVKIFRGGKMGNKKLVPKPWRGCGLLGFRFGNVFK